ncbi:hypothetical protein [Fibrella forsythiae]|uniref:Uncharacterized protein n=1 Tax=Fibrella forsythiae TaxID=2817061 RepID=A0ABS3JFW6_9BACT|nr:hypothetical protein [Fibrella forsythiae]MBO0947792.1 hypothetical protein [Fibrella forsythiae]
MYDTKRVSSFDLPVNRLPLSALPRTEKAGIKDLFLLLQITLRSQLLAGHPDHAHEKARTSARASIRYGRKQASMMPARAVGMPVR